MSGRYYLSDYRLLKKLAMNTKNKLIKNLTLGFALCVASYSCQKMTQPALPSDYPTDIVVVPTTPLRFFRSLRFHFTGRCTD